jgi:hypothetical protein
VNDLLVNDHKPILIQEPICSKDVLSRLRDEQDQ